MIKQAQPLEKHYYENVELPLVVGYATHVRLANGVFFQTSPVRSWDAEGRVFFTDEGEYHPLIDQQPDDLENYDEDYFDEVLA